MVTVSFSRSLGVLAVAVIVIGKYLAFFPRLFVFLEARLRLSNESARAGRS